MASDLRFEVPQELVIPPMRSQYVGRVWIYISHGAGPCFLGIYALDYASTLAPFYSRLGKLAREDVCQSVEDGILQT